MGNGKKKAIIAMSGGVDSSVAAYLMQEAGYEASGAMMRLFDAARDSAAEAGVVRGNDNAADARMVADKLGIDFTVYDMRTKFKEEVIEKFVAEYESGRTPNPCVFCNRRLKFEGLYEAASGGADAVIATGHYAVIEYDEGCGRYKLRKAADPNKDQSYFLYALTQEQLARTMFPLGGMTKQEVRKIAAEQGFVTAEKKESQDICFIPGGDYTSFIHGYTGKDYEPGNFVDEDGNLMGRHKGIINYTIGQRKGLGLALKKPAYVLGIDTENNTVILGDDADLYKRELIAEGFNWVSVAKPDAPIRASARIRYRHREAPAEIIPLDGDRVKVVFDEPQRAITRGQSVVVYDGDCVLGGGVIS